MKKWLRLRTCHQAISVLKDLEARKLLHFALLGRDSIVKYSIANWARFNTILDYNCPCQKDSGFFFLPFTIATDLVSVTKCSEMDIILDLWVSAVYNDDRVHGSELGPVFYSRNGSGNPLASYAELGLRWGHSKATVGRVLKKLTTKGYISMMTFPGRYGTAIYLANYLSTMFQISDVPVDKAEVALSLSIPLNIPDCESEQGENNALKGDGSVSTTPVIVSKSAIDCAAAQALKALENQGFSCAGCGRSRHKLYPLSDGYEEAVDRGTPWMADCRYRLEVYCAQKKLVYVFDISIAAVLGGRR